MNGVFLYPRTPEGLLQLASDLELHAHDECGSTPPATHLLMQAAVLVREIAAGADVHAAELANADRLAGEAARRLEYYQDSASRRDRWLQEQKHRLGYGTTISFDTVWANTLKQAACAVPLVSIMTEYRHLMGEETPEIRDAIQAIRNLEAVPQPRKDHE